MSIIDRGFLPDRLEKDRNRSSKVIVLAAILIAILMFGATAGLMVQVVNNKAPHQPETPARNPARVAYTTHSPISIVGNGGFTNASGVVGGVGTESDPYIISDWDINASTAMIGISINETDAHFIVKNCYVHESRGGHPSYPGGINLHNCTNGALENNICSNKNHAGIKLESSSNNTVSNNSCSGNDFEGIWLDDSGDNTLSSNTCRGNLYGILLIDSHNNMLINNTCSINWNGIKFDSSNNNTLSHNNCSNNGDGTYLYSSSNNTLIYNNCSSNDRYGVFVEHSDGNRLTNNTFSHDYYGAEVYTSSQNVFNNNTFSRNLWDGMRVWADPPMQHAEHNEILGNSFFENEARGVMLDVQASGSLVSNNTLYHNNGAGDSYDPSHAQAADNGWGNCWNSTDGYGNYWSDWTGPDANMDRVVDLPYDIAGGAGAEDYYPLTMFASNNLPPSYVMFSIRAYGPPWDPPWVFVNESVHFAIILTDPEFDAIELIWDFGDGSPNTYHNLSDYVDGNVTCEENHTYTAPGNRTVVLRFTDNQVGSLNHSVEFEELIRVLVDDVPPVANAGEDQTVVAPTVVDFNGTESHDDWGEIANYTWTFMLDGTLVTLWGQTPSFEFTEVGIYEVTLKVTDHVGNHNTTTVTIEIVSAIPEFGMMPFVVIGLMAVIVLAGETRRKKKS